MHFNTSVCLVVCFCGCVSTSQWAYLKKKRKAPGDKTVTQAGRRAEKNTKKVHLGGKQFPLAIEEGNNS